MDGSNGSRGIQIGVSRRVVFVLLAGFAFLVLSAVFSKSARADLLGPIDLPIGETIENVADVVDAVIPLDPVAQAVTEVLPPVVQDTVTQVVETVPTVLDGVTDVLPPVIDETVTAVVEEVISPAVEQIGDLVPTPVADDPSMATTPVDEITASTSSPAQTSPVETQIPAGTTLVDHQQQTEVVAVMGVIEHASPLNPAGIETLSTPSGPDPVLLYGYVPIAGQAETLPGGANGRPATSNLFGANYGDLSMSPIGFLALLAVLFNFAVVGYLRDRASAGRSFFPGHPG